MQKMSKIKRFFVILLSMVIAISPTFFSGCKFEDYSSTRKNPLDFETHYGGGGGGNSAEEEVVDPNAPPRSDEISEEEYYDYFKNYRITYKPGEVERESFNQSIKNQNAEIAESILTKLYNVYGDSTDALFQLNDISLEFNNSGTTFGVVYIKHNEDTDTDNYYQVDYIVDYDSYYNHKNAILGENSANPDTEKWVCSADDFVDNVEFKNRIKLAEALILAGNYIDAKDGGNTFDTAYSAYNTLDYTDDALVEAEINNIVSGINHIGYTQTEIEQLSSFVLKYVIGEEQVNLDNSRFVNAYSADGLTITVVDDENYNRFLTEETYYTVANKQDLSLNINVDPAISVTDDNANSFEGLLYYAQKYMMQFSLSQNNSVVINGYISDDPLFPDENSTYSTEPNGLNALFTQTIYNNLIATDYRKVEIKDENENVIETKYNFDANVWGYNKDGEIEDKEFLDEDELGSVLYKVNNTYYSLFSIRLPYFKNYYNTVNFMVNNLLSQKVTDENKADLDAKWRENHPDMDYPYSDVFPTVPLTYFTDLDSKTMVFDEEVGEITMKDSGFQVYQSFMIMPEKDVYMEDAFFLFQAPEDPTGSLESFNITVYVRYFDGETQSYATWERSGVESEFYSLGTVEVEYSQEEDGEYTLFEDLGLKSILTKAKIEGTPKGDCLLEGFDENAEVLCDEPAQLVTKDNYGYWFNYQTTPEGQDVVCFDGKNAHSSSYLEFVFYNPTETPFVFMFYPEGCYKA